MASAQPSSPASSQRTLAADPEPFPSTGGSSPKFHSEKSDAPAKEDDGRTAKEREEADDKANEVTFGPDDPENPHTWSRKSRIGLTLLVSLLTINVTFASTAPTSAIKVLSEEFNIGSVTAGLITTLFLLGYCVGPLINAPLSEMLGRRPVFLVTMAIYTLFVMGNALSQTAAQLFILRFLSGVFASSPLTNAGGVISDIWDPVGRGLAMSLFTASVFIGPSIAPPVAGFIIVGTPDDWRLVFWVTFAFAGFCWVLILFFLPETYAPILLKKRALKMRKENPEMHSKVWAPLERQDHSFRGLLQLTVIKPFKILFLEPILQVTTVYLAVVYGVLYGTFSAFPIIWEETRGFNVGESGLIFLGTMIGSTIGALLNGWFSLRYRELTPKWHGTPPPENRLQGAMLAGPLIVIGLFFLGWTGAYPAVPWYVPMFATILLGAGFALIFISLLSFIVDVYLMHAASALAANTICRSAMAAGFSLFTTQMYHNLGIQWASTLLGCIAIVLAPSPFLFYKYGHKIRGRSRFAPNIDLKIKDEVMAEEQKQRGGDEAA